MGAGVSAHIWTYLRVFTRICAYLHLLTRICACLSVSAWICTYSRRSGRIYASLRVSTRTCPYLHLSAHICARLHVSARICTYLHRSASTSVYLCVLARICAYLHVCARICTYMHVLSLRADFMSITALFGTDFGLWIGSLKLFASKNRLSMVPSLQNNYCIQRLMIFMTKHYMSEQNAENQFRQMLSYVENTVNSMVKFVLFKNF